MRFRVLAVPAVLAAAAFVVVGVTPCRADDGSPAVASKDAHAAALAPAPRAGTEEEERAYAKRESESKAAQEFAGGQVVGVLILIALVVLIVLLVEKKI